LRLLERLKSIEATAHIRSIVYSSQEEMRKPVLEAGAYDFILKGEVSELRDSLERLMGLDRA
jgi:PleD family two-component response regulator